MDRVIIFKNGVEVNSIFTNTADRADVRRAISEYNGLDNYTAVFINTKNQDDPKLDTLEVIYTLLDSLYEEKEVNPYDLLED